METGMRKLKVRMPNPSNSPLENYLIRIGQIPLISIDEVEELVEKIRQGGAEGEQAQYKLTETHLRFVVSVAKQYQNQGLSLMELIDAGNDALYRAAGKYAEMSREKEDYKFISYAVWWIRQGILQAIAKRNAGQVGVPQ